MALSVDYPITRPFAPRWFAIVTYSGAFILLVLLAVINSALAGYETVTVFTDSYNATHSLWFHKFLMSQAPKPGTLCDAKLFNVGDTFTTNYSIFQWQVEYIAHANVGSSGFAYRGTPLDGCDVTSVYIDGDLSSQGADVTGIITCKPSDGSFEFTAHTSYTISALAGNYHPILGVTGVSNPRIATSTPRGDSRALYINLMSQVASYDLGDRAMSRLKVQPLASPDRLSVAAQFPWCPQSMAGAACSTSIPTFTIQEADIVLPNNTLLSTYDSDPTNAFVADFFPPLANLLQVIYASMRVDLGISSPNNILTQDKVWLSTINSTFPRTATLPESQSVLGQAFLTPGNFGVTSGSFPLSTSGAAEIRVVYPCKFQQPKKLASAIIAVISATSAMFSAAWSLFLVMAATVVKRDPKANECLYRCDCMEAASRKSNRLSFTPIASSQASERRSLISSS
ncbi:hypothetical protein DL96DRAFT_1685134 [Flagelloscypha sp. PMI_526]|nr:hypothetical protein DL96DRAFT_1685134 [Flagelloscypha sp. PMI_526]